MSILVFNAGSSSLKFALFEAETCELLVSGSIDWADGNRRRAALSVQAGTGQAERSQVDVPDDRAAVACAIRAVVEAGPDGRETRSPIDVVGHRVVHGGSEFCESVRIDDRVKAAVAKLSEVAPIHNPPALEAIRAAETALPQAAQIAVFDTAFYARMPPRACVYPVPYEWYAEWGVRRFGFHGTSHMYCTQRAAEMLQRDLSRLRIISCHLGGGCSAVAVQNGVPVATTMGFTPLEGLMMGTRCGSIDPGILLHVQRGHGLSVEQVNDALNYRSGLLGVSGVSPDFAKIERAAEQGNPRAQLARDMFADRVRAAVGSLAVAMGGVDVLIFTDRVGEGSAALRAMACQGLECLGVLLDRERNAACQPDCDIASAQSPARILVLHTREELMIAREAWRVARAGS